MVVCGVDSINARKWINGMLVRSCFLFNFWKFWMLKIWLNTYFLRPVAFEKFKFFYSLINNIQTSTKRICAFKISKCFSTTDKLCIEFFLYRKKNPVVIHILTWQPALIHVHFFQHVNDYLFSWTWWSTMRREKLTITRAYHW